MRLLVLEDDVWMKFSPRGRVLTSPTTGGRLESVFFHFRPKKQKTRPPRDGEHYAYLLNPPAGDRRSIYRGLATIQRRPDYHTAFLYFEPDCAVTEAERTMILAARALPDRDALKFLDGNPLIFADWLEAQGQSQDADRIRQAHGLLAPAQG